MPRIIMLCRCRSARTVLFVVQENGLYALPGIRNRQSEDRRGVFERFIADHFVLDPGSFHPEFRTLGLVNQDPVQIVLCTVDRQVSALAEPGVELREFRWIGRLECQQNTLFESETLLVLQDPGIQRLLFELPY